MKNSLLFDVGTAFHGYAYTGLVEHVTFDQGNLVTEAFHYTPGTCVEAPSSELTMVNSLITDVGDWGVVPVNTNYTVFTNSADAYEIVGASSHYLKSNSVFRAAGTNVLSTNLLKELRLKTTRPPLLWTNNFTTNTVLQPRGIRDTNPFPDLGFHFDVLDYCMAHQTIFSNVTLILTNGVAIGFYATNDSDGTLLMEDGSALFCDGKPTNMFSRLVWYHTVQSEASSNWALPEATDTIGFPTNCVVSIQCRFTDFSRLAGPGAHIAFGAEGIGGTVSLRDSQFRSAVIQLASDTTGSALNVGITNSLFEEAHLEFVGLSGALTVHAYNNLFFQNSVIMVDYDTNSGPNSFTFRDNFFYTNYILASDVTLTHDHNAYLTNAPRLPVDGTGDVVLTNFTFLTGDLSRYYQPTNSPLLDAGSRNATNAGLFHWTVLTNNLKESNSLVDIGAHWVALNTNGAPFDSGGGNRSDYLEDSDGDGFCDAGTESCWNQQPPGIPGLAGGPDAPPDLPPPFAYTNGVWLSISNLTATNITLAVHGTTNGAFYGILSRTNLNQTNWTAETGIIGGSNLTITLANPIVFLPRTNLFFIAGYSGADTDGDGLPDWYEQLIGTLTNDTDTDDDGIFDLWEVLLGTNPNNDETALTAGRLNYDYRADGPLRVVSGKKDEDITPDAEGNIQQIQP